MAETQSAPIPNTRCSRVPLTASIGTAVPGWDRELDRVLIFRDAKWLRLSLPPRTAHMVGTATRTVGVPFCPLWVSPFVLFVLWVSPFVSNCGCPLLSFVLLELWVSPFVLLFLCNDDWNRNFTTDISHCMFRLTGFEGHSIVRTWIWQEFRDYWFCASDRWPGWR